MGTFVLVCAVIAAMAAGVLFAYAICRTVFSLFRLHGRYAATGARRSVVGKPQVAEA